MLVVDAIPLGYCLDLLLGGIELSGNVIRLIPEVEAMGLLGDRSRRPK